MIIFSLSFSILLVFFPVPVFVVGCPEPKLRLCFQFIQWHFGSVFLFFSVNTVKQLVWVSLIPTVH